MVTAQIFVEALAECDAMIESYPNLRVLNSVRDQVNYIADLYLGKTRDRSRIKDLVLGVQLAKQVEPILSTRALTLFEEIATYADSLQQQGE
jgi:hypothetical protein